MSATNRTTNYNLPIFIETDKPAWLVDFNGAMRSIDAQMKINADAIATKSPILTFNDTSDIDFTKSGDIITANLSSGVAGNISRALLKPVSAPANDEIVSIDTSGNQSTIEIGQGLVNDNGTLKAVDLDLTSSQASYTASGGTVTDRFYIAVNNEKTIGKVYGFIGYTNGANGRQITLTTPADTVARPSEQYTIYPAGMCFTSFSPLQNVSGVSIDVNTNGSLTIRFTPGGSYGFAILLPCLYFFKDFGDEPNT